METIHEHVTYDNPEEVNEFLLHNEEIVQFILDLWPILIRIFGKSVTLCLWVSKPHPDSIQYLGIEIDTKLLRSFHRNMSRQKTLMYCINADKELRKQYSLLKEKIRFVTAFPEDRNGENISIAEKIIPFQA